MRDLAAPLALLIVVLAPVALIGAVGSAAQWVRWLLRAGGPVGVAGLVLTAATVVNLFVPRTCATTPIEQRNRPILSVVVDDGDCFRSALGQLGLVGLVGVTASAVVATRSRERGAAGAAPVVPYR